MLENPEAGNKEESIKNMNDNITKICKHCGKVFTPKSSRPDLVLYCSTKCKQDEDQSHKERHEYVCSNCGCLIHRASLRHQKHYFCSKQCQSEFSHKQNYEERSCEYCGEKFECTHSSTKRFCSPKCQIEWQRSYPRTGEEHPSYNHDFSIEDRTKICQCCGKEYQVSPYKIMTSHFCSEECRQIGVREYARTRKTRAERVNTKPQRIVNEILQKLNISYINEYRVGAYSIDNYCLDKKLFIEVMGTYWHADIRKYTKIDEVQKRDIIQDKRKRTYIKNQYNKNILYLWEKDILDSPELCSYLIQLFIENDGIIDNYHSYNYILKNNKIHLREKLLYGYIELQNDYHSLCK